MPSGRWLMGIGIWKLPWGKVDLSKGVETMFPWADHRVIWIEQEAAILRERVQASMEGLGQIEEWNAGCLFGCCVSNELR